MFDGNLPDKDHVVRYLGAACIDDGKVKDVGFFIRWNPPEPPEEGLSANWLEYYLRLEIDDKQDQLERIRRVIRRRRGKEAKLAELNVGTVRNRLKLKFENPRVEHHPLQASNEHPPDPSHSEIRGIKPENRRDIARIGDMIAKCVCELHPARNDDE